MDTHLSLLLIDASTRRPLAADGLSESALAQLPRRPLAQVDAEHLFGQVAHPNDLRRQGWGLIIPADGGEPLLDAVAPLVVARAAELGVPAAAVRVLRFARDDDPRRWIRQNLPGADLGRPRYILLLGDFDDLPVKLQTTLARHDYFVGRLAFDVPQQYRDYADKVVAWEHRASTCEHARVVMIAARTGDAREAPDHGYAALLRPARELAVGYNEEGQPGYAFTPEEPCGNIPVTLDDVLAVATDRGAPTLLWTVSHGLAARGDRRRQGQPFFGQPGDGDSLTPEHVAHGAFLPGGFWFLFACFGAGTPERSIYAPWLTRLRAAGDREVEGVAAELALRHLPGAGRPAFVAAVPKAALANPDGPLAVLGHIDLAWVHGYRDLAGDPADPRERFLRVPSLLADPSQRWRAGAALAQFGKLHEIDAAINDLLADEEAARSEGAAAPNDPVEYGRLWMHRQDLANYILLGDPGVRLPFRDKLAR